MAVGCGWVDEDPRKEKEKKIQRILFGVFFISPEIVCTFLALSNTRLSQLHGSLWASSATYYN
jgi:hypothetical protein